MDWTTGIIVYFLLLGFLLPVGRFLKECDESMFNQSGKGLLNK